MATIATAYHAASDDWVAILNIADGIATVVIDDTETVTEIAYRDLSRVVVNSATIDAFATVAEMHGAYTARTIVLILTGSAEWARDLTAQYKTNHTGAQA